ncbi:MAG TPA: PP2C family protein-serine/threonine phosphatase [Polyangia bacterium]|nr:PP2C family protein-serine/threonine phosphatase [Polyangia bacterium]
MIDEPLNEHGHRRELSTLRLKVMLMLFISALLIALSLLVSVLATRIFNQINPAIADDLEWKARRGATELAEAAALGIAIQDRPTVERSFGEYRGNADVAQVAVLDRTGALLASYGRPLANEGELYAGPPGVVRVTDTTLSAWAAAKIEGNVVGKVALVVSKGRLRAGQRLRREILGATLFGCLAALVITLFFVNAYLGPLVTLTHRGLRTARELEIAKRIQTSILPTRTSVRSLEIAASMMPATEVGGDYYDVIPVEDGAWIAIGDVAGHGVQAGLIMMMVQSVVASATKMRPDATPAELWNALNRVLIENVRGRMGCEEHVTFSLMRYTTDGRLVFAGAHEDVIICRVDSGKCEQVETPGTWLGIDEALGSTIVDTTARLRGGDVMVLYTDGITEARNAKGEMFGRRRLVDVIERHHSEPSEIIRQKIIDGVTEWMDTQDDDVTVLVLRYGAEGAAVTAAA